MDIGSNQGVNDQFVWVVILVTRLEFGDKDIFWSAIYQSKCSSDSDFGKTGMSRHHFDLMWRHV